MIVFSPGFHELPRHFKLLAIPLIDLIIALDTQQTDYNIPEGTRAVAYFWDEQTLSYCLGLYNPVWPLVPEGERVPLLRAERSHIRALPNDILPSDLSQAQASYLNVKALPSPQAPERQHPGGG